MADSGAVGFRHEAFLYAGADEFVAGLVPFVQDGLRANERVVVAVQTANAQALADALGADATAVTFLDMRTVGRNPGRILSVWQDGLALAGAHGIRGIGEPVWPGRSLAELAECRHHELLLNLAFDRGPAWRLVCPYDVGSLDPDVLAHARTTHPVVADTRGSTPSGTYTADYTVALSEPLPDPPATLLAELSFGLDHLPALRQLVRGVATGRAAARRVTDFVTAVNEAATNSIRHGGGWGRLRMWSERRRLVCEVADRGRIDSPLIGRERPGLGGGGCGVWLMHQLCDLVQLRSSRAGTVVRMHLELNPAQS